MRFIRATRTFGYFGPEPIAGLMVEVRDCIEIEYVFVFETDVSESPVALWVDRCVSPYRPSVN